MAIDLLDTDERLPTSAELPCSDDTPVDNENQNTLPNWLLAVLEEIWSDRQDWYFGVDMGIYDREAQKQGKTTVVPDGFLSVGVQRHKREGRGRLSYVLQEEQEIVPLLALEMVSKTYNGEYDEKMQKYASLGVKYYVVYNPEYSRRDKHAPWEIYQLGGGRYQLQKEEPFWIPEIGLGLGRRRGEATGIIREWLAWYDRESRAYPLPQQIIQQQRQRSAQMEQALAQERQRAEMERQRSAQMEQALAQEHQRAEMERQRSAQIEQAFEQERLEKLYLLEQLRQLGLERDQ